MRRFLALVILLLPAAGSSRPAQLPFHAIATVTSPDDRTSIVVGRHGESEPFVYRVTRDGDPVLDDSPLGIRRIDQTFEGSDLVFVGASETRTIDDRYTMPHGKQKAHHVAARERTVMFKNGAGARVDLVLRAQDDGVAFRYRFPESTPGTKTVVEEMTGFRLPEGSTAWMMPQQEVHKYGPAYEDFYRQVRAGTASERPDGWAFPALFKTAIRGGRWLLITESALDETFCGSHLAQSAPGNVYRIKFPDPKEGLGVGKAEPTSTLPWTMPWRVIIVGDAAGRILESDMVLDVAPPSKIGAATWVRPGRAAWSWWSKSDSPRHAEELNAFTDLAADMGWEYALVDANWNLMQTGTIEDVIAHAKAKNVGLLFWYNSGGPHNDVTEAPRDRMDTREARRAEFAKLKAWGVRGVKVDFWHSDKQDRIAQYRDLLKDAADFRLMVDFHGSTIPRGWSREFPNLVGMEAVFGAEQYKFRDFYAAKAPWHNTVLPFTRNVAGPMDFTPVTFTDAKYPHQTTNAHELALSVMFESPVQHFADSVESYRSLPEPVRTFLKQVPSAWDETRMLSGEPGEQPVIARRDGNVWYVAGLNGMDVRAGVAFKTDFLGPGKWRGSLIADGTGDREFKIGAEEVSGGPLGVDMRARGGFVMRLEPADALDVYFIDVEGGQATLLVTPSGQSMLIDTGYPGFDNRDVNRVLGTIARAGLTKLDYLLVTHYHTDHAGNAAAIAAKIPVGTFIDHGEPVESDDAAKALYAGYVNARANARHLLAKPGEDIPFRDLEMTILTAAGAHITRPVDGSATPNPSCAAFRPKAVDASENARSVGSLITFGAFRMIDLGDLTWNKEQELVCPNNLVGTVDLYLSTHHGLDQSNAPVIVHALKPRVAVMNNGPTKGGSAEAMRTIRSSPGLIDFWQLHYAVDAGKDVNMPEAMIANLDESEAHYIKLTAHRDGSFIVTNSRTGETRRYDATRR